MRTEKHLQKQRVRETGKARQAMGLCLVSMPCSAATALKDWGCLVNFGIDQHCKTGFQNGETTGEADKAPGPETEGPYTTAGVSDEQELRKGVAREQR